MSKDKFSLEDQVCRSGNKARHGTIVKETHPYYTVKWDKQPGAKFDGRTTLAHCEDLILVVEKPAALQPAADPVQYQVILPENFDIKLLANSIADSIIEKLMDLRFKKD